MVRSVGAPCRRTWDHEEEPTQHADKSRRDKKLHRASSEAGLPMRSQRRAGSKSARACGGEVECSVDALVERIRRLCQERRSLRAEIEASGARHRDCIQELRSKMLAAQQQHGQLRAEQERLRGLLAAVEQRQLQEKEHFARLRGEGTTRSAAEAEKLERECQQLAGQLAALEAQAQGQRQRLGQLQRERSADRQEASVAAGAQRAVLAELKDVRSRAQQVDAERLELERKYSVVGQHFEHAMDLSEKENREAAVALKARAQGLQRRAEKQQRRLEGAKAELERARALVARQSGLLGERDLELQQLQRASQDLREDLFREEEQVFATQCDALQARAAELQKQAEMMPLATHQEILREQSEYYSTATRNLEEVLRQQLRVQEEAARRQQRLQDADGEGEEADEDDGLAAEERFEHQRCLELEASLREAGQTLAHAEASAATHEQQRSIVMGSLESASSELSLLRDVFETQRSVKGQAEAQLAKARDRLQTQRGAIVDLDSQRSTELAAWSGLGETEASIAERSWLLSSFDDQVKQLQGQGDHTIAEVAALETQCMDAEEQLHTTQRRILQLDEQKMADVRAIRAKQDAIKRVSSLVCDHNSALRRSCDDLRLQVKNDSQLVVQDLEAWAARLQSAFKQDAGGAGKGPHARQEGVEDAGRANAALAQHLNGLQAVVGSLRAQVQGAVQDAAALGGEVLKLQDSALRSGRSAGEVLQRLEGVLANSVQQASPGPPGPAAGAAPSSAACWLAAETAGGAALAAEWPSTAPVAEPLGHVVCHAEARSLEERRAAIERQTRELAGALRPAREAPAAPAEDPTIRGLREQAAVTQAKLEEAEAEAFAVADRVRMAKVELDTRSGVARGAAQEVSREVSEPLCNELQQLRSEAAAMQEQLPVERQRRAAEWERRAAARRQQQLAAQRAAEDRLQEQVRGLRRELLEAGTSRAAASQGQDGAVQKLQDELASVMWSLDESQREIRRLEAWREGCLRGVQRQAEGLRQTESRLSDVATSQLQDARVSEDEEREMTRQHGEAVAAVESQQVTEAAQLDAALGRSLYGLTAELAADGDAVLRAHAELKVSGERLRDRARLHLNPIS